jgi:uncharacterized protein (DUF2141 family)
VRVIPFLATVLIFLILASCAKQSTPMGGPIDEDPPLLLESNPKSESLNISPEKITLTFNEYVGLENPTKGIIITPRINKDKVTFTANKNTVTVALNQDLEANTTYVFNFQKSVVDISEKNPAENLKLVFSTGAFIDSLSLGGKVNFTFPDNRLDFKNVLVGIYPVGDTTDVFTAPPYYLSQVDSSGNFKVTNIKNGKYLAYAWKDENGSLKAEFKSEEYDFLKDTLEMEQDVSGLIFNLSKADFTPIRILRTANIGRNFDFILNKNAVEAQVKPKNQIIDYQFIKSEKRLRIYPKESHKDSIQFQIHLKDSVGFSIDTLIWAKFPESERKPEKLTVSANSGKSFYRNLAIDLKFNKPLSQINPDSLYVQYDTASFIRIDRSMYFLEDSSKADQLNIRMNIPDSLTKEIFTLKAADSTFRDIEGVYNDSPLLANYKKLKGEAFADEISGTITGAKLPLIVQLIDSKDQLIKEVYLENSPLYSFTLVEPGNYKLRVIEDLNGNRRWDPANFPRKINAERVFFYTNQETKNELTIRAGWTLSDQNITASPPTGITKD